MVTHLYLSLPLPPRWPRRVRIGRLTEEIHLLEGELRLKDARMSRILAQRRPHYLPIERLSILELRAARGWSQAQTSERMQLTPATVASRTKRLDEEGPDSLVQRPVPVNRFPDFVAYIVKKLKVLCPAMGKVKMANVLARAGLHLGSTTVARVLKSPSRSRPVPQAVRHRGLRSNHLHRLR
jgi:hypothetical protein